MEEETKLNPVKRFKAEMSNMSNKLLITNLPVQVDYATIHKLLSSYNGYQRASVENGKALVTFESIILADKAKTALDGFEILPGNPISIAFSFE